MVYSTKTELMALHQEIGRNYMEVFDLDGNVFHGIKRAGKAEMPWGSPVDGRKQDIPFGTSPADIDRLVEDGVLKRSIMAKAMDTRLYYPFAQMLSTAIEEEKPFRFAALTSRDMGDALRLLEESGVEDVSRMTIIADSGATMRILGDETNLRPLNLEERQFLGHLRVLFEEMQPGIDEIVRHVCGSDAVTPKIWEERKRIATNGHFRSIVEENGQVEGSTLDKMLGTFIKGFLADHMYRSPKEPDGSPVFKLLAAPMAVEVIVASVSKGVGLSAVVNAAAAWDKPPSAFVFSGDDVSKAELGPGTDYYGMIRTADIAEATGMRGYNVLTLSPKGGDIQGTEPNIQKLPDTLPPEYPRPKIHGVVRTSFENVARIMQANGESVPPVRLCAGSPKLAF